MYQVPFQTVETHQWNKDSCLRGTYILVVGGDNIQQRIEALMVFGDIWGL